MPQTKRRTRLARTAKEAMSGKRVPKRPTYTRVGKFAFLARTPPPVVRTPSEPLSLPLAVAESGAPTSDMSPGKPRWRRKLELPADSVVRKKAAQIIAMKIEGHSNEEICTEVHLSERSLRQYLWLAGHNGWVKFVEPKDELEYGLAHKAVRNLDAMMDSDDIAKVRMPATFKVADIVLTPQFENAAAQGPNLNVLSITVQHVEGPVATMREGTVGGVPAYVDAEVALAVQE